MCLGIPGEVIEYLPDRPDLAAKASPRSYVTGDAPPILTFQGTKDPLVPHTQAIELADAIDPERHADVARRLATQERDAVWWRDAVLLYFQTFAHRPLPDGVERPAKTLEEYKARSLIR